MSLAISNPVPFILGAIGVFYLMLLGLGVALRNAREKNESPKKDAARESADVPSVHIDQIIAPPFLKEQSKDQPQLSHDHQPKAAIETSANIEHTGALKNRLLNAMLVIVGFLALVIFFYNLFANNEEGLKVENLLRYTAVLIAVLTILVMIGKRESGGFILGGLFVLGFSFCLGYVGAYLSPSLQLEKCLRYAWEHPLNPTMEDFYYKLLYEDKTDVRFGQYMAVSDSAAMQEFYWLNDGQEKSIVCAVP